AKSLRVYPSPEVDVVSVVPSAGAEGLCIISLSQEQLGVGIYPFDGAGGSGGGGTLAGLTDVNSAGATAGAFLTFGQSPPTCRQRAFGDLASGSVVVTLLEPA